MVVVPTAAPSRYRVAPVELIEKTALCVEPHTDEALQICAEETPLSAQSRPFGSIHSQKPALAGATPDTANC